MKLIALLAASALLAACGSDEEPKLPTEGTLFEYSRAGGIAFSLYEVSIDADGTATVSTTATGEPAHAGEFKVPDEDMDELRSILEETPISSLPDPGEPMCADCFEYTYAYGGDEFSITEAAEPVSELDQLNEFIDGLPIPDDTANGG